MLDGHSSSMAYVGVNFKIDNAVQCHYNILITNIFFIAKSNGVIKA